MGPVSTGVSIVLGICSGLVLGKYVAARRSSFCSAYMVKYNTEVNYELFWK